MENTNRTLPGVKDSWDLLAFARVHGLPFYADNLVNKETGSPFTALMFEKNQEGKYNIMVSFSEKLGILGFDDLIAQKDTLQVCLLNNNRYVLAKKGANSWREVALW